MVHCLCFPSTCVLVIAATQAGVEGGRGVEEYDHTARREGGVRQTLIKSYPSGSNGRAAGALWCSRKVPGNRTAHRATQNIPGTREGLLLGLMYKHMSIECPT